MPQIRPITDLRNTTEISELCHAKHADNDEDAHIHFFCEQCHRTFCLRETPLPTLTLPADYLVQQVQLIVKGICPACRTKGKARL